MPVPEVGPQALTQRQTAPPPPQRSEAAPRPTGAAAPTETASTGAVTLETLRQQSPRPGNPVSQDTLNRQSRAAGEARGVLTDPRAIVQHELSKRDLTGVYQQLAPQQRRQFDQLVGGLVPAGTRVDTSASDPAHPMGAMGGFGGPGTGHPDPEAMKRMAEQHQGTNDRNNLYSLLEQGKLGQQDSQGNTLLTNLRTIQNADYPQARATLSTALGATQPNPYGMQSLTQQFASGQPAEFARVADGLMRNGQVKLANGDTLRRPPAQQSVAQGFMGDPNAPWMVSERTLGQYADQKLADPRIQSRVTDQTRAHLSSDTASGPAFTRLSPEHKQQFVDLAVSPQASRGAALALATGVANPGPQVDSRLTSLLSSGRLTSVDSQGETLLTNLHQLKGQQFGQGFAGEQVYNDVLNRLSPQSMPTFPGQAPPRPPRQWGVAIESDLLQSRPSEYVRVMSGLTGTQGRATLGGRVLQTPPPGQQPQQTPGFPPLGRPTDSLLRESVLAEGMRSGQPVDLVNSNGQRHQVTVQRQPGSLFDRADRYRLRVGDHELGLRAPPGQTQADTIGQLADYWSMTPSHLRGELKSVTINSGRNPADGFWEKEYNIEGFRSAATAGDNTMNFWGGTRTINEGTFNHEMGHLIGQRSSSMTSSPNDEFRVPRGWTATAQKDGNAIESRHGSHAHSDTPAYSTRSVREDFAESWRAYMKARTEGKLTEFRAEYPNRAPALDRIYSNQGWR